MDDSSHVRPTIAAVGLALVVAVSAPAIRQLAFRHRGNGGSAVPLPGSTTSSSEAGGHGYLYEDEDGRSTSRAMRSYSDRRPKAVAWASGMVGLGLSISSIVLLTTRRGAVGPSRLSRYGIFNVVSDAAAWVCVCLQCFSLPTKHQYRERRRLAAFGLVSALILFASLVARFGATSLHILTSGHRSGAAVAVGICWSVQMLAAAVAALSFASFPQRPDVFYEGRVVDQQHAVSLLRMLTYSWNDAVFHIARKRQLEVDDLPELDDKRRVDSIHSRFLSWGARNEGKRLWRRLIEFHAGKLAQQWALAFAQSIFALFPQYVLYNFLEILDSVHRGSLDGPDANPALFSWVLCLFASLMLQLWASNFMRWLTSSHLEDPVLSLLQAMVFDKAMRLRDTASAVGKAPAPATSESGSGVPASKQSAGDADLGSGADTRQSVVNHLKLDTNRLVMFSSYSYYFPVALFKLVLAGSFLSHLVGWKPVAAGLSSAVFVLPISRWLSKKYGKIQFGLMKYRDGKAHLLTEALQGMRQIKFSALEKHWEDKILASRNEELAQFWRVSLWMSLISLILNLFPMILASVTLSVYAFTAENGIRASVVFASIGLLDQLDDAIGWLPILQVYLMESWTSCVRLERFFAQPERVPISTPGDHIAFENAEVAWPVFEDGEGEAAGPPDPRSVLRGLSLGFPNSKLSVVTGKTGSGKSLLLAAILGEATLVSGCIRIPPAPQAPAGLAFIPDEDWVLPSLTAFVAQSPWIESGTVRENILFGLPLNARRYAKVLAACALEKDMELLADGDNTEVGPKGVQLSGGQRWRIALARALYSRAGILILDDVLSAVDAHVGRIIVEQALTGELARGRTRILATHHADMCMPWASYLVRLHGGALEHAEALMPSEEESAPGTTRDHGSSTTASMDGATAADDERNSFSHATTPMVGTPDESDAEDEHAKKRRLQGKTEAEKEETREKGRVKWRVYKTYITAGRSSLLWLLAVVLIVSTRFILVGRTWTLKEVSESDAPAPRVAASGHAGVGGGGVQDFAIHQVYMQNPLILAQQHLAGGARAQALSREQSVTFWMAAYVVLGIVSVAISISRQLIFTAIGLRTARVLFERMTRSVLRAPMGWISNTPSGRILNRFTSDVFTVDRRVSAELGGLLQSVLAVLTIVLTSLSVSKYVNLVGVAFLVLYTRVATQYISAARDIKRINSVVWSPIYDSFSSVLAGLSTVRGFGRSDFYTARMHGLINTAAKSSWALVLCQRWMAFRMGAIGVLFVALVAGAIALSRLDAALAGFGLSFALQYTSALTSLLSNMSSIELGFNATERVLEYCDLETEPQHGEDAPAAWPTRGEIEIENLSVSYGGSLPPVLKNINLAVRPGERIGIVGRTGAGKSTLASVLFRLLEPQEGGCVRIDGLDIARLKLAQLRSRISIIPQDPFLFSGTLRSNLDMEGEMEDAELQAALQRVHLVRAEHATASAPASAEASGEEDIGTLAAEAGRDAFRDLSTSISAGGTNMSQGERQLVCLARALLSRPKIVLMDESTSSIDSATDEAIQESLREEFGASGCTVLVIAHRLSTVADFDRILVLRDGRVAEIGTPAELLRKGMAASADASREAAPGPGLDREDASGNNTGAFWDLVRQSAEKDKLMEIILGKTKSA